MRFEEFKDAAERILTKAENPLFIFDDDPDGLCSYLLLRRAYQKGSGMVVKTSPHLTMQFLPRIEKAHADCIVILDIANVDQELIDALNRPIIWIDHHSLADIERVLYYNPIAHGLERSTAEITYDLVGRDAWIALIGAVSDYRVPETIDRKYPDLIPERTDSPDHFMYESRTGELVRIFAFALKGMPDEAIASADILLDIEGPYELLEASERTRALREKYEALEKEYTSVRDDALSQIGEDRVFVYVYTTNGYSMTTELANELSYRYPSRLIIIARLARGAYRMSIRCREHPVREALEHALRHVRGGGGGHLHACGAHVHEEDFEIFIDALSERF